MILIDAGPLVALCNPRDALHAVAIAEMASMADSQFALCEAVLIEACFHLRLAPQRRRLRDLLAQFNMTSLLNTSEPAHWAEVFDWLSKYADHHPDWADGCIAVLCGHDRKLKVWTYDSEFWTIWRRPDGSAIPMALRE